MGDLLKGDLEVNKPSYEIKSQSQKEEKKEEGKSLFEQQDLQQNIRDKQ